MLIGLDCIFDSIYKTANGTSCGSQSQIFNNQNKTRKLKGIRPLSLFACCIIYSSCLVVNSVPFPCSFFFFENEVVDRHFLRLNKERRHLYVWSELIYIIRSLCLAEHIL